MKRLITRLNYRVWTAAISRFLGYRRSMDSVLDLACGNGEFLVSMRKKISFNEAEGWDLYLPKASIGSVKFQKVNFLKPFDTQVDMTAVNVNLITFMNSLYVLRDLSPLEAFLRVVDFDIFVFSVPNERALRFFDKRSTADFKNTAHDIHDFMTNAGLKLISKVDCVPAYYLGQPVRTVLFGLGYPLSEWAERRAKQKYYELYFCEKSDVLFENA